MVRLDSAGKRILSASQWQIAMLQLLRRADYSTANLSALAGDHFAEEKRAIVRIKDATIDLAGYPATPAQKRIAELEAWENEGGAIQFPL